MAMKFDIIGSDDLSFPVTIDGSLTVKELFDKVNSNHQHVLTSIGQARPDFLLALRYKEKHALAPNEVISQVLSNGENLVAIWASTLSRVAPGRHKSALFKLAQHVAYANGSFYCTLGIIESLAINAPIAQVVDSKSSAPKKQRANELPKTSAANSFNSAPAPAAASNVSLPSMLKGEEADSSSSSESGSSTGSSSSSVSSESSHSKRAAVAPAQVIPHTVQINDSSSESVSSASSVSSSSSSGQSSTSSATSSSHASAAKTPAQATPKAAAPVQTAPVALQARAAKAPPAPRADVARKSGPAKAANAALPVKSAAPMPSPAAPTEKAILAQISTGVAIPSSTPKKRGARGGKNSVANKAKTAAST